MIDYRVIVRGFHLFDVREFGCIWRSRIRIDIRLVGVQHILGSKFTIAFLPLHAFAQNEMSILYYPASPIFLQDPE